MSDVCCMLVSVTVKCDICVAWPISLLIISQHWSPSAVLSWSGFTCSPYLL